MADPTKTFEPASWLSPFEAGRQWMELASKTQTALAAQFTRSSMPATFSPQEVTAAFSQMFTGLMRDPAKLARANTDLWNRYSQFWSDFLDKDATAADKKSSKDRRFRNEEWDKNVAFSVLKHSYLIGSDWLRMLAADTADMSPAAKKQVEFFTERFIDAAAPTNLWFANPDVLKKTAETGGANLAMGFSKLVDDLAADAGHVRRASDEAFELGVNIAASKGSVIARTDMMELIQYEPTTPQVARRPLLLVPPWVNKFYLFDLQPKSSFIKWATDQGYTVFAISWVNPDSSHAEKDFSDYWLDGPMAALETIERATGERAVNIVSYCLGGTLTAVGLAYLAAKGEADRVGSATMIATMTDFERFGDFEAFVTEEQVVALDEHVRQKGYVDSADLSRLFSLLRANDLIWSSAISSYLMADDPVASDLLYWFSDGIGMPGKMLSTFVRKVILDNALSKSGALDIAGTPIDLAEIETPVYFVSLKDDHVAAWEDTYRGAEKFRAEKVFTLGGSGHNAGTINPPAAKKHGFWTNAGFPSNAQDWLAAAQRHDGSWWPTWSEWLKPRSGDEVPAREIGGGGVVALEPAPGSYARVRR